MNELAKVNKKQWIPIILGMLLAIYLAGCPQRLNSQSDASIVLSAKMPQLNTLMTGRSWSLEEERSGL